MYDIRDPVNQLDDKIANVEPRFGDYEIRLPALEDNLDERIKVHRTAISAEFSVETTLMCSGLREISGEAMVVISNDPI